MHKKNPKAVATCAILASNPGKTAKEGSFTEKMSAIWFWHRNRSLAAEPFQNL